MALSFLLILLAGATDWPPPPVEPSRLLAQTFQITGEEAAEANKYKKKPKPKPKKDTVETESDIWKEPVPEKKPKKDEDVEEVTGDEDQEEEEGQPEGVGGWGEKVERENWGDEERIENAETLEDKESPPSQKKPPVVPDAGIAVKKPDPPVAPRTQPVDAGTKPPEVGGLVEAEQGEVLPPAGSMADLDALYERRRMHLAQRDFQLADEDLAQMLRLKRELSVRNLILPAYVLIREGRLAWMAEDFERANKLVGSAREMAPDLPAVYLAQASLLLKESPVNAGKSIAAAWQSATVSLRDPLERNRFLVNLTTSLLIAFGLLFGIWIVTEFLRYLNLFLHDFHHLFPRGVAKVQTAILAVLVLLIPVLFRTGLLSVLLLWVLIAWIYMETKERVITAVALVFFAASPLLLRYVVVPGFLLADSAVVDSLAINRGAGGQESVSRLKALATSHPDNPRVLAILADFAKRTFQLDQAREQYNRAIQLSPDAAFLHNNLGNVHFLRGELDKAVAFYSRAVQLRPDLAVPYYNLSRVYAKMTDMDKANEHRRRALQLDKEGIKLQAERAASRKANDVVGDLPIPDDWLLSDPAGTRPEQIQRATSHLWRMWGGIGPAEYFPFVSGGIGLMFALALLLRRNVRFSSACVRCGRPVCGRCTTETGSGMCEQCVHAFLHKEQIDARARISKEIQIRQHTRRKESLARFITFVLPGVGQLIKDRPVRGTVFLLVSCCILVQLLQGQGVMRSPLAPVSGAEWWRLGPLLFLFLGFYLWAILDIFRTEH